MKIKIDKIVALGGSGLLGYYLGLSMFRGILWNMLLWALPPINTRHLPTFYTAIMGAIIGASIGYLLYTKFIEKCSIKKCKKQYALGITALLLLPLITIVSFRIQAVNYVRTAEAANPTGFDLHFEEPRVSFLITEDHGGSSSTSFGKNIRVQNEEVLLDQFGAALRQLELVEVSDQSQNMPNRHQGTIWIDYRSTGKWYSKILSWRDNGFEESASHQGRLLYKGAELETVLGDIDAQLSNLTNFTSAEVLHTSLIDGNSNQVNRIPLGNFQFLLDSIQEDNIIVPDSDVVSSFEARVKDNQNITKKDINYYAFSLKNQPSNTNSLEVAILLENVILYDDVLKIAWFEGEYYKVDLSSIL
ncbi:hypothetical protein SAMN05446037_1004150 [Anaerovirgula multivorans]|uniref:Uncharacterized protein n=1 Tax=Anaerovirgula multivorans TaxID=312168 RepID=A0A239BX48_9FIRM|nr:hypothetical protein [Anaerovirgula multivorans]SNS11644.1 hypothetical protein SAMN05446037_1004150 [Anaerovirgula multivorans]